MTRSEGDVFPETTHTWIGERLRGGPEGLDEVRHHVMSVYLEPLKVYFRGRRDRWIGDPDEMVLGFFSSRLSRADYLARWLDGGTRLRYWLIKGLDYYIKEEQRRLRRDRRLVELPPDLDAAATDASAEKSYEREFARSIVREALRLGEAACAEAGLAAHWKVFVGHFLAGRSYPDLAPEHGVSEGRAGVMSRTAAKRFRLALRGLMLRDGVAPENVAAEIRQLLEGLGEE